LLFSNIAAGPKGVQVLESRRSDPGFGFAPLLRLPTLSEQTAAAEVHTEMDAALTAWEKRREKPAQLNIS
jgi:hypothetical protein